MQLENHTEHDITINLARNVKVEGQDRSIVGKPITAPAGKKGDKGTFVNGVRAITADELQFITEARAKSEVVEFWFSETHLSITGQKAATAPAAKTDAGKPTKD